ncbi:radical SAM protein [Methanocella sp. MCL-LM]|uniref:radical SAM protein n=1 Tax=Methanocella sp. MCL-LM TaxID=3412035 RepID=UPI003C78E572
MDDNYVGYSRVPDFPLWSKIGQKKMLFTFDLELTARCNNACRHCYINLPAGDKAAMSKELSIEEIENIADQAVAMGAVWCLITGGEPLLRKDFEEIYLMLKKKGLLLSVFTNACLITEKHVELFRKYPPRDLEVTVYGITAETYEKVSGKPGSYAAFRRGLDLLLGAGIPVRLKAVALRSNVHELPAIAAFCRAHTKDYFRFDPLLHLRFDGDPARNAEIREERLSPAEIVAIEQADAERSDSLAKKCDSLVELGDACPGGDHLFNCGAGKGSFSVSYDGRFRLCSSLWHPDCVYDLRKGSLKAAMETFVPKVLDMRSTDPVFLEKCRQCQIIDFCLWCPAHAHLESGRMDAWCDYFCQVAHARVAAIRGK